MDDEEWGFEVDALQTQDGLWEPGYRLINPDGIRSRRISVIPLKETEQAALDAVRIYAKAEARRKAGLPEEPPEIRSVEVKGHR